ncbi:MAG: GNAT family N-acetyltransferase [Pseudomonadota bacterium]
MTTKQVTLSEEGFYDLPAGMLATVVTSLEMRVKPTVKKLAPPSETELRLSRQISADDYRNIYRHVGEDWLWFSRMLMSDAELTEIIHHEAVDVYQVFVSDKAEGLLELDYRVEGECEVAFFGLSLAHTGRGLGPWLMTEAIAIAWARPIRRLWLHTCTFDHPRALAFYQKQGFRPFKQEIELVCDPRLNGALQEGAAAHVPMISGETR